MADKAHVDLLKQGVEAWNAWRAQHPSITPALRQADLRGVNLRHANLRDADLSSASLQGACLASADLTSADLGHAHVSGADFDHAVLVGANLRDAVLGNPEILRRDFWHLQRYPGDDLVHVTWAPLEDDKSLRSSDYVRYDIPDAELEVWRNHIMGASPGEYKPASLSYANLEKASLERAICDRVSFRHARLVKANLKKARLVEADFSAAVLTEADVADADLTGAAISKAALTSAARKRGSRWADAAAGVFEGSVHVHTHGFHEYLATPTVDSAGDFHVTLIHGTFARDADWVDNESALAGQLSAELEQLDPARAVHTHTFRWSGRNTFGARRQAADDLRAHLRKLIQDHPAGMHCAVAHSHGGTVLLHALRDGEIAQHMARVVCISTPFLRLVPAGDEWRGAFSQGLKAIEAIALLALALWLSTLAPRYAIPRAYPVWFAVFLEISAIVAFLAVSRVTNALFARWKKRSDAIYADSGHPQLRLDQAMCIRTASDEAGFAIGLGATLAWLIERAAVSLLVLGDLSRRIVLSPLLRLRIGWPVVVAMCASYVALLSAFFVVLLPASSFLPAAYVVFGIAGVCLLPGLLLLPFVLLLSVCYIPFGHDLGVCTPFLRATVEAAPSGIWHVFQFPNLITLPLFKMQHSFVYEYSPLRVFIARWLVSGEFVSMREWREA